MDELDNSYFRKQGMWNYSEQWSNTYEAETVYYAHLENENTLPTQAYDAWCAIAVHRRPVPHLKVVAGHAGKGKGGRVNGGHLEAFRNMHGIPAGALKLEYHGTTIVGVKEAFPGAWNPSEHRPPSNISGAEMAYYAVVGKKETPLRQAYDAWCAIAADQRPKPHIKVVAGHAKIQTIGKVRVRHLEDFRRAHGIPAGTLTFENDGTRSKHLVAVEETSPGAWNRALRAMSSATADLPVTGYGYASREDPSAGYPSATEYRQTDFGPSAPTSSGHLGYGQPPLPDATLTDYYSGTISNNDNTSTSYNSFQDSRHSTLADTYSALPSTLYSHYSMAPAFTAQQPANSVPTYENMTEAGRFLQEFGGPSSNLPPLHPLPHTADAYAPPTHTQPPTRTTNARSTAPTHHQPQRRLGR